MKSSLRWDPYHMRGGQEFESFWKGHLGSAPRNLLYVLGRGFDPRMCSGIKSIIECGGTGLRDCVLIRFDEGPESPSNVYRPLVDDNETLLRSMLDGRGGIVEKTIEMWSTGEARGRRIGSRSAASVFKDIGDLGDYSDVVVDISALPRGIFAPLIGKILYLVDHAEVERSINVHVVVSENSDLDRNIQDAGIDDVAGYVHGFSEDMETEATSGKPRVWVPILGEGQSGQLERIYTLVNPDEICPVIPWPSSNPRRGDDLIIEYRELLFDRWRVEPGNIVYASERNPFEAYRQVHQLVRHYSSALEPLGGCKVALSAVSSKLLSLGSILAAYELKENGTSVGLAHVESQGFVIGAPGDPTVPDTTGELFNLWLAGECYET